MESERKPIEIFEGDSRDMKDMARVTCGQFRVFRLRFLVFVGVIGFLRSSAIILPL